MIPSTDIDALHEAIKTTLAAQFPACTVAFYSRPGERIPTPAILLEIEDIMADDPDEIGTEQLAATINVNAYCVMDYKAGKKKSVRSLAASVMAFARGKRWGQPVGAANVGMASPDTIAGREDDYEVMRVEWSHEALLGADVWTADQIVDEEGEPLPPPTDVFVAEVRDAMPPAEEDYQNLTDCNCQ